MISCAARKRAKASVLQDGVTYNPVDFLSYFFSRAAFFLLLWSTLYFSGLRSSLVEGLGV